MEILHEVLLATGAVLANFIIAAIIGYCLYRFGLFPDIKRLPTKARRWGRAFSILVAFSFMVSGLGKVVAFEPMVAKFTQFNMMHLFTFVGISEMLVGLIILFPKTYKIGVLLGTATAGGAIATHLPEHSDGIIWAIPSSSFLGLLWLSAVLYAPHMFPEYVRNLFHKSE